MTSRVLLFIASVLALSACSNEVAPSSHEAPADVIYESSATHEVWERLDEATVLGTEAMGPQLTAPVGPLVRSGEPVAFTWTESEAALELRHRKSMLHAPSRLALVALETRAAGEEATHMHDAAPRLAEQSVKRTRKHLVV